MATPAALVPVSWRNSGGGGGDGGASISIGGGHSEGGDAKLYLDGETVCLAKQQRWKHWHTGAAA